MVLCLFLLKVYAGAYIIESGLLYVFDIYTEKPMEYLTTEEIAEKWGISKRRVQRLVQDGRIDGAVKKGVWLIPSSAVKPSDPRKAKKED